MVVNTDVDVYIVNKTIFGGSIEYSNGREPPATKTVLVPRASISSSVSTNTVNVKSPPDKMLIGKTIVANSIEHNKRIPKISKQVPAPSLIALLPVPNNDNVTRYCDKCGCWNSISSVWMMSTHNTAQCRNWNDNCTSKWYNKKPKPTMYEYLDDCSTSSEITEAISEADQEWFRSFS